MHLNCGTSRTVAYFTSALNDWLETDFSEARPAAAIRGVRAAAQARRASGAQAAVRHAFKRLGLSRRMMNKVDPRKWSPFNMQWRADYLTEICMYTEIHTVYFFDEAHVQKGAARYCWWYQGTSAAASTARAAGR